MVKLPLAVPHNVAAIDANYMEKNQTLGAIHTLFVNSRNQNARPSYRILADV